MGFNLTFKGLINPMMATHAHLEWWYCITFIWNAPWRWHSGA